MFVRLFASNSSKTVGPILTKIGTTDLRHNVYQRNILWTCGANFTGSEWQGFVMRGMEFQ